MNLKQYFINMYKKCWGLIKHIRHFLTNCVCTIIEVIKALSLSLMLKIQELRIIFHDSLYPKLSIESAVWWFSLNYALILTCYALPTVLFIAYLINMSTSLYGDWISMIVTISIKNYGGYVPIEVAKNIITVIWWATSIIYYLLGAVTINIAFILAHRRFQNNFSPKAFVIQRDGTIKSDIKFILTLLSIVALCNIIIMLCGVHDLLYNFLSTYFILSTVLYLLMSIGFSGHKIISGASNLKV